VESCFVAGTSAGLLFVGALKYQGDD